MHPLETGVFPLETECIPRGFFCFGEGAGQFTEVLGRSGELAVPDGLPKDGKGIFKGVCVLI